LTLSVTVSGRDASLLYSQLRVFFEKVSCTKPKSSRNSSIEAFVVGQGFRLPAGYIPTSLAPMLDHGYGGQNELSGANRVIVPYIACGDLSGYDADQNYPLGGDDYVYHEPVQQPIKPKAYTQKNADITMNRLHALANKKIKPTKAATQKTSKKEKEGGLALNGPSLLERRAAEAAIRTPPKKESPPVWNVDSPVEVGAKIPSWMRNEDGPMRTFAEVHELRVRLDEAAQDLPPDVVSGVHKFKSIQPGFMGNSYM